MFSLIADQAEAEWPDAIGAVMPITARALSALGAGKCWPSLMTRKIPAPNNVRMAR